MKNESVLREFCKVALDVEKERRLHKSCECCTIYESTHLYVIKTLIYGIYHVCNDCKVLLVQTPAEGLVCFIQKFSK